VQQVLLNLVANAIKYNREGGRVVISGSERPGGVVRIEVRDTGAGIPAQAIDRLFVPFERLSAEHSGVQGSGMGLALSKALIEAMHGTVGVESTVGHGSTFWFQLPGPSSSAADPVRVEASSPES
jgi:signal transduction histidine kinase